APSPIRHSHSTPPNAAPCSHRHRAPPNPPGRQAAIEFSSRHRDGPPPPKSRPTSKSAAPESPKLKSESSAGRFSLRKKRMCSFGPLLIQPECLMILVIQDDSPPG